MLPSSLIRFKLHHFWIISGFPGRALPDLFIFSDSLHHSLPFPIVFIFRLGHFGTCPPSSRLASYPIVFRMFLSSIFGHFRFFPSSSRFASRSTSSGYFAFTFGSFRNFRMLPSFWHCLMFPSSSRFVSHSIIPKCSRISCSDFPGLLRLLPDSLRIPSLPNLSVFFPFWPATKSLIQAPFL